MMVTLLRIIRIAMVHAATMTPVVVSDAQAD